MIKKLIILTVLLSYIVFVSIDLSGPKDEMNDLISVEIRGEVERPGIYEMKRGSILEQILGKAVLNENADISSMSLQEVLYGGQLIVIPAKRERKLVSINTAGIDELCSLPGIGTSTAEKIIEYRQKEGPFLRLEDLMNVKGIGNVRFGRIKENISL